MNTNININLNIFMYINYFSEILFILLFILLFIFSCYLYYFKTSIIKLNNLQSEKIIKYNISLYPNLYSPIFYLFLLIVINIFIFDILVHFDFNNNNIILIENHNINIFNKEFIKTKSDLMIKLFIFFLLIMLLLSGNNYLKKLKIIDYQYILILYSATIFINLLIYCVNLVTFYLLVEIQGFSFIVLTAINYRDKYSLESSLKYFILHCISSSFMLYGITLFYGLYGTTNIHDFYYLLNNIDYAFNRLDNICITFILIGFLFKLYVAPFHFWISDIYNGNLIINTIYISTIGFTSTFYLFFKFYNYIFIWFSEYISLLLFISAIISIIIGSFSIVYETNIKKIVAFSSIFTIGLLLINLLDNNYISNINVIYYFILYIINIFVFLILILPLYIMNIYNIHVDNIKWLNGYYLKNNIWAIFITISILSNVGLPGTSLFLSKLSMLNIITNNYNMYVLYSILLCSFLIFSYALRIIISMYFLKFKSNTGFRVIPSINYIISFLCVCLLVLITFNQFFIYNIAEIIVYNI